MEICRFYNFVRNRYNLNNDIFVITTNNHFLGLRASLVIKRDLDGAGFNSDIIHLDSDYIDFDELRSSILSQCLLTNKNKLLHICTYNITTKKTFIKSLVDFIQEIPKFGHKAIINIESQTLLRAMELDKLPNLIYLNLPEADNIDNFNQWRILFAREIGLESIEDIKNNSLSCIENEYWKLKLNLNDDTQAKKYIYTNNIVNQLLIWLKAIEEKNIQKAIDCISELICTEEYNFSILGTLIINHINWGKIKVKDKSKIINFLYYIEKEAKNTVKFDENKKIRYMMNIILLLSN